jgi:mono/diheme cytochrome c family protein
MRKNLVAMLTLALMVLAVVGLALAEGNGNARKGKYLYRKSCRGCHAAGGAASDLSPNSHTQAEWKKLFAGWESIKCANEWKALSDEERNDIFTYLHDFAADSPSPAKCS